MRQHSIDGVGGRPRWRSATARVCPAGILPAGPILEGALPGPVRSQGEGRTMRDPRAAWTRGGVRAAGSELGRLPAHGNPGVNPRVVIGVDADEVRYLDIPR